MNNPVGSSRSSKPELDYVDLVGGAKKDKSCCLMSALQKTPERALVPSTDLT
jgi:hypothetical protein